jgi:hypothetical protein
VAFGAVATAYFLQQLVEVRTRGFLDALVGQTAKISQQTVTATKAALGKLAVAGDLGPDADKAILEDRGRLRASV